MFLPFRKKLLEVKCPFSCREILNISEAVTDTDCFLDPNKNLKKDHKYYAQVQCQLFVCKFEKCDFVVWALMWLDIKEIERNDKCLRNITKFLYSEYFAASSNKEN